MTEGQKPTSKIVVLISGSGSNLQSIINACEENKIDAQITAVISNKYSVKGLDRSRPLTLYLLLITAVI